ncbi:MAG: hypothetical protein AAB403_04920 [Planctomycetota bacterium]
MKPGRSVLHERANGDEGIEQTPLSLSKTPIPQTQRAKSGAPHGDFSQNDPDLAAVVRAWPDLSEQTKTVIKALIQTQRKGD